MREAGSERGRQTERQRQREAETRGATRQKRGHLGHRAEGEQQRQRGEGLLAAAKRLRVGHLPPYNCAATTDHFSMRK